MKAQELLAEYRYCTNHFNKKEYPGLIDRISESLAAYFSEVEAASADGNFDTLLQAGVDEILDEVEANKNRHRFKFRQNSIFADDHLVLSLFVVPAAAKMNTPIARRFAELMAACFVERFEGTTFLIGDIDEIMEGFRWKLTIFTK